MTLKLVNKTSKVNYYGIEVDPEITWNGWEPGNKYTKKLILKNVKFVTQKLNFSVPGKEVFSTTFPKTITLSAGTSFCLPITFKPHKRDVFEDQIDFQTTDGDIFTIPVKALLPQYDVDIPAAMSCGTVAAHDVASETVVVQNRSELETPFQWCCASPYAIDPSSGVLSAFESMQFTIRFQPQDVSTFTMSIPFLFGEKFVCQKVMSVTSVAKYPNICLVVDEMSMAELLNPDGQIVVDFGIVSVGNTYKKNLQIHNASEVNASVEIIRADLSNPIDWVFSCPVDFSPVPSGTCLNIMMEYHPKLVLANYVENFIIKVSNKCATFKVKCVGKSDGPMVSISHTSINFFQLFIGEKTTHKITLTNNSAHAAVPFQFAIDPDTSVFHIDKCSGTIKPKDWVHLTVTFRPQNPIQYYRTVACLVPDQEPMFIDLMGTCHDMHNRPYILQMKHLHDFKKRQIDGLSYFSPEALMGNVEKNLLKFDENDQLSVINEEIRSTCETVSTLSSWKEYFFSHNETDIVFSTPYIGQDEHSLYFDGLEYINKQQIQERLVAGTLDSDDLKTTNEKEKTFSLKNNTKGTLIIQWTTGLFDEKISVFSVSPCTTSISPNETVNFTVKFQPDGPDRIYGSELEGFAYFKSQRQFELVNERFISPPFCVLLRCAGHSFSTNSQPFQPKFAFDRTDVVFPSTNLNETAFRSYTLTNRGTQPMIFNLQKLDESFSVKPILGQIQNIRNSMTTFSIRQKTNRNGFRGLIWFRNISTIRRKSSLKFLCLLLILYG